jgi:MarR-like DNA-binding transcriptional regulator SgrR of sgrS sRNA
MYLAAERYLTLLNAFGASDGNVSSAEVSIDELAVVLFCTTRNVKIILHKLVEEGLIEWQAGRGRGNRSRMTFLADREPILMEWAQQLAEKGEYKQAFELLQTYSQGSDAKDRFVQWLNSHFGYESEQTEGSDQLDMLRFPVYRSITTLDPSDVIYAFDAQMIRQIFDRLVTYDLTENRFVPGLAHAWDSNADATEWTFYLRKGVRFHHGRELTADDVRFSLERLHGNKLQSWMVRSLKRVESLGPRTVRVSLDKPNRLFLRYLCSAAMSIVPKELEYQDEVRFWAHPMGTGPFRVVEWTEDRLELAAYKDYYLGRAHLDRIVIATMPEDTATASATAQWQQLITDHNQRENKPEKDWKTIEQLYKGCTLLSWNLGKQGPQQSEKFRCAVNLLIHRQAMIRQLGEDRAYPAHGFRPTEQTPYLNDEYDSDAAEILLKEGEYDGSPVTLGAAGKNISDALWIKERCAQFGISVNILRLDSCTVYHAPDILKKLDCVLYGVIFTEDEVCEIENYHQHGNFLRECLHPQILEWAEEQISLALASEGADERRQVLSAIEKRLYKEGHVLFLLHKKVNTIIHPNVKGVGLNALGWMDFKDIWLEARAAGS